MGALQLKSIAKSKKISRKDAKTQSYRQDFLCVVFAALRLCVRFCF